LPLPADDRDLRREAIKAYTQQINNLGVAFAEQTSRNLQASILF